MCYELLDDKAIGLKVETIYQYVLDKSNRLRETGDLTMKELLKARDVKKAFCDNRCCCPQLPISF